MREDDAIKRAARDGFIFGTGYFYMDEEGAHYVDPRDVVIEPEDDEKEGNQHLEDQKKSD